MPFEVLHVAFENPNLLVFWYEFNLFHAMVHLFLNRNKTRLHWLTCEKRLTRFSLFLTKSEYRYISMRMSRTIRFDKRLRVERPTLYILAVKNRNFLKSSVNEHSRELQQFLILIIFVCLVVHSLLDVISRWLFFIVKWACHVKLN